jgi:hypothetical protein
MFNSFFGIDFIKNQDFINFIEINPRLTTSYIGIRNILKVNPVEYIFNNEYKSVDFKNYGIEHHSIFKRVELEYIGDKTFYEIRDTLIPKMVNKIPEFVTPPISFKRPNQTNKIHFSGFIATKEKEKKHSKKRLAEIYDILRRKYGFVIK